MAALALACLIVPAKASHKAPVFAPGCNVLFPCEGAPPAWGVAKPVAARHVRESRGAAVVRAMGVFGVERRSRPTRGPPVVQPRQRQTIGAAEPHQSSRYAAPEPRQGRVQAVVAHPEGCPARAFCGCGAAVRVFGHSVRELWLAANWFKFPRAAPAPGMAAVRRHHVFVLEADLGGGIWQVFDANSGHHLTRIHARSLAGYTIVNPRGGSA